MSPAKPITALITILGLAFIVSMCNNVNNASTESSVKLDEKSTSQEAQAAAIEADLATQNPDQGIQDNSSVIASSNNKNEEIPFKVNSQEEYNKEMHHTLSLVERNMSNIYEQNSETQYRIMCLELPIMAFNLKAFADANPEYSDPKVSFNDVVASIEAAQKEIVGSCN
ncbi:hypothetical protein [Acinetobacter sp. GXMZU3951]